MRLKRRFGEFRLYVPGTRYWYNVHVCPDRKTMHNLWRDRTGRSTTRELKFFARCDSLVCDERRLGIPCRDHGWWAGDLYFAAPYVGVGIVAHEMLHAAHAHMTACGFRNFRTHKNEERLAELTGELVRKFWQKWWKLPLRKQ